MVDSILLALKVKDMKAKIKESMGRAQGRLLSMASKLLDAKPYKFHSFGLLSEINAHDLVS